MRYADAAGQPGGHLLLTGADVGQETVQVGAPTGCDQALAERAGRLVAVVATQVEDDLLVGDERHDVSFREVRQEMTRSSWGELVEVTSTAAMSAGAGT